MPNSSNSDLGQFVLRINTQNKTVFVLTMLCLRVILLNAGMRTVSHSQSGKYVG